LFRGTGRTMSISTCFAQTDYPTELYVFDGCGGACVPPSNNPGFDIKCPATYGKTITIDTNANIYYRVLVKGTGSSVVGNHRIAVDEFDPPLNALCTSPTNLVVDSGAYTTGTTFGAPFDNNCFGNVTERGRSPLLLFSCGRGQQQTDYCQHVRSSNRL
jgi:hypothetical protein